MNNFICINDNIVLDENIGTKELYLFMRLVSLASKEGYIEISLDELMKNTKYKNRAMICKYLSTLKENGYITKVESESRKSAYKLNRNMFYK